MKIAVVVPTIREDCMQKFLAEWRDELAGARLIVVEDNPEQTFDIGGCEHYSWRDIDADLGASSWIIPRRTSACRSYGFYRAYHGGADVIWTLDDDCYPEESRRGRYLEKLAERFGSLPDDSWHNTLPSHHKMFPRGYPYDIRHEKQPVMVHHGMWSSHPDFDGLTQKANPDFRLLSDVRVERIPTGKLFPMCVMNLAFRAEMTPAMYMLLMGCRQEPSGSRWGFDRFDDIWAGLFMKRIADHLGFAVTSGSPSIKHSKASNADTNIRLEAPGIKAHETFWRYIASVPLTADTVAGCYRELANAVAVFDELPYWLQLGTAMATWARLIEDGEL
jgi:hypothetical protein